MLLFNLHVRLQNYNCLSIDTIQIRIVGYERHFVPQLTSTIAKSWNLLTRHQQPLTPLICRVIHYHYTMPLDLIQCSGGSKGGTRDVRPPGLNSFNFMQFLRKFGKIVYWVPPGELVPPPRGNPGSTTAVSGESISTFPTFPVNVWIHPCP